MHKQMSIQEIEDYVANGIKKYKWSDEFLIKELAQQGYEEEDARNLIAKVKKERHVKNNSFWDAEKGENNSSKEGLTIHLKGLTIHPFKLIIGVVVAWLWFYKDMDWELVLSLAIVVIIHELGHVVIGKSFGCIIEKMQVFLLSFVSYKPKHDNGGGSWKNITWSLGILPLGGFTTFKMQKEIEEHDHSTEGTHKSPFIDHKPAGQRLLIYAGGILFNIATFVVLYRFYSFFFLFASDSPGWFSVCYKVMILSLVMAVLNILPVYPLDGGAIIFSFYEVITGKKPASWFVNICCIIGFAFIVIFFWIFPDGLLSKIIEPVIDIFFSSK